MRVMASLLCIYSLFFGPFAGADCPPDDGESTAERLERLNHRYDDFFRYQRERDERQEQIQAGAAKVKIEREIHEKELERARQEYKRVPKDYAREEALRIAWEKTQKDREKAIEVARLCEVQKRRAVEEAMKKGRQIPAMKEFDLDDY